MKNIIILLGALFINVVSFGQSNVIDIRADETVRFDLILEELYSELDVSDLETEFLLDKSPGFSEKLLKLNGSDDAENQPINGDQFDALYRTIRDFATVREIDWPISDQMLNNSSESSTYNEIGFRVLIADCNRIRESAVEEGLLYGENDKIKRRNVRAGGSPFLKEKIVFSAPYRNSIITGGEVRFNFNNNLKFTNNGNTIDQLEIDFNDGNGYIDVTHRNYHSVSYSRSGSKIITCKITSNRQVYYSKSTLLVKGIEKFQTKSTLFGQCYDERIAISVPQIHEDTEGIYNQLVGANAYIRYGCGNNNKLRKPIIFVEGIDFGEKVKDYGSVPNDNGVVNDMFYDGDCGQFNRYGRFGWFHFVNGSYDGVGNISILPDALQKLHSDGHDVILLDFKAGAAHIENNAETLIYLLNYINGKLSENNSDEQSIVSGISMGGQVARYALRKMENENIPHNVSTFVSIDSPNNGANIPLGLQYNIKFVQLHIDKKDLIRPATKQLLLYHYKASVTTGFIHLGGVNWNRIKPRPHELHTNLYNSEHMTTFPQNCRNVAISNGSKLGTNQGYSEGDVLLNNLSTFILTTQSIKSWAMKEGGDKISRCRRSINTFGLLPSIAYRIAVRAVEGKAYDHISGGYRTTAQDIVDGFSGIEIPNVPFDLNIPNITFHINPRHAFIPTFSGLGISESYKMSNLPTVLGANYPYNHDPNISPFDVIFADAVNHKHVFMDAINTAFLMGEYSPNTKYVQNKTYWQGIDTYSARDEVIVGRDIDPVQNRNFVGDVVSTNTANTTFYAGKKVTFHPGVKLNNYVGRTHAYIREYCNYTQGVFKMGETSMISDEALKFQNTERKSVELEEPEQLINARLYPNPNKGIFKIDLDIDIEEIVIYNMYGQVITSKLINSKSASIHLNNAETGIYIAKIKSKDKIFTKRFSIVN